MRFATNCHAPTLLLLDTAGRAAACIGLLSERRCLAYFYPQAVRRGGVGWRGGQGGCRLSVTAERNDCRLFLTAFDRYFSAVQTGWYGYNNRRARSSCPSFLFLCLSTATLTRWHVHVWTGCVRRGVHSWGLYTSYRLHGTHKTGPLNLLSSYLCHFFQSFLTFDWKKNPVKNLPSDLKCFLHSFFISN